MTELAPTLPRATSVLRAHDASGAISPADTVDLSYEDRCRRRMRMTTRGGRAFLLDLPKLTELSAGDYLPLDTGDYITVAAADEALMEAVPTDPSALPRLAWHVGNRHLPAEIRSDRLVLRYDHVIEQMLIGLGSEVLRSTGPFTPMGGAYGQGRTHGHSH